MAHSVGQYREYFGRLQNATRYTCLAFAGNRRPYRPTICANPTPTCENFSLPHGSIADREVKPRARPTPSREAKLIQSCYLE